MRFREILSSIISGSSGTLEILNRMEFATSSIIASLQEVRSNEFHWLLPLNQNNAAFIRPDTVFGFGRVEHY